MYLRTTAAATLERIRDRSTRPLLSNPEDAKRLLAERSALYAEIADIEIDTVGQTPVLLAEHIAGLIRKRGRSMSLAVVKANATSASYEVLIGPRLLEDVGGSFVSSHRVRARSRPSQTTTLVTCSALRSNASR